VQYQDFRHQIEEIVGRINGTVGTISSAPVHYLYQMLEPAALAALYAACDVMLVTPLRDGMNLVAKEFVVCRPDEDGVLVLSEFAGAAEELREAIIVNPYDVDALTASMRQALLLGRDERRARMRALRSRVIGHGAHEWAESFLAALAASNGAKAA
jgi:trehalose 6-phosphate synthase/phosphatase